MSVRNSPFSFPIGNKVYQWYMIPDISYSWWCLKVADDLWWPLEFSKQEIFWGGLPLLPLWSSGFPWSLHRLSLISFWDMTRWGQCWPARSGHMLFLGHYIISRSLNNISYPINNSFIYISSIVTSQQSLSYVYKGQVGRCTSNTKTTNT